MCNLSGEEAKLLWANGAKLQINFNQDGKGWENITNEYSLGIFEKWGYTFRIKPETIILNNIEIPAPYAPKIGEWTYVLNGGTLRGYEKVKLSNRNFDKFKLGSWRTEEEIKLVVELLAKKLSV
jgi:hypothetical protein